LPYFLSCDWGTSNFRLRLVDRETLEVRALVTSADGIDRRTSQGKTADDIDASFRSFLETRVAEILEEPGVPATLDLSRTPLWISGMASSTIGWRELPYAEVPFALDGSSARVEDLSTLNDDRPVPIRLISGIATSTDVLRGEETQALGILADTAERELTLVLPGTHSKHLVVRDGSIVDFHTFMTGETYELFRTHSILRHSIEENRVFDESSERALREGARAARERPLLSAIFSIRTRQILDGAPVTANDVFLSGLLIGSEILGSVDVCGKPTNLRPMLLGVHGDMARLYLSVADELGLTDGTRVVDEATLSSAAPRGHAVLSAFYFDELGSAR